MQDRLRITCPGAECSKEDRIKGLMDSCFDWVYSDSIRKLVSIFDGKEIAKTLGNDKSRDIETIHEFVRKWDFRKGAERSAVVDSEFVKNNEKVILKEAEKLGLVDIVNPQIVDPDYLLPLGGLRMSNLDRPLMCRKIIDEFGYTNKKIVALSGTRPRRDTEDAKEYMYWAKYAPNAETEYEAISAGLEIAFNVAEYTEQTIDNSNINLCSAVRRYKDEYKGSVIYSLAAPSPDPQRRANSRDTFEYLLRQFNIGDGEKLLLCTSCIYVPYQYLKFMSLAIEHSFEVDCIGSDTGNNPGMSKPSNYLQEIKGTIDAIYGLYNELAINECSDIMG